MFTSTHENHPFLIVILTIGVVLAVGFQYRISFLSSVSQQEYLVIGKKRWKIFERATDDVSRVQGLAGREFLPQGQGVLFIFDAPAYYSFWMKGMHFPLDVIFIRDNKVDSVVYHREPGNLKPMRPNQPIDRVFEVNAGEAEGVFPGDEVRMVLEESKK